MNVEVLFPEELLLALKEDPESFRKKVLIFTLGKLYEAGRISGGLGAKVLGCDRWEFYRLLSDNGFAVLDYPDEELDQEGEVGSEWRREHSAECKAHRAEGRGQKSPRLNGSANAEFNWAGKTRMLECWN
jgi:predicted HTH domain antitoxin